MRALKKGSGCPQGNCSSLGHEGAWLLGADSSPEPCFPHPLSPTKDQTHPKTVEWQCPGRAQLLALTLHCPPASHQGLS